MSDVERYITQFDNDVKGRLLNLKLIIQGEFPRAETILYHGIPAFFQDGRDIINFGVARKHITLYPGTRVLSILKDRYPDLCYTKATIRFPNDAPMPYELIREICEIMQQELGGH